jgi:hypothetical protein
MMVNIIEAESQCLSKMNLMALFARFAMLLAIYSSLFVTLAFTQNTLPENPQARKDNQLNVNWF